MTSIDTAANAQPLADLAESVILAGAARIFLAPAHALCPGDVILIDEFTQVSVVHGGRDTITVVDARGGVHDYDYAAWHLIFRPAHPAMPCPGCDQTWFEGCEEGCTHRYEHLEPARVIEALGRAGLLAPGFISPYDD
jgi:hypothetical protein